MNKFWEHLDECKQCRECPFDLCSEGQRLLVEEAKSAIPNLDFKCPSCGSDPDVDCICKARF